MFSPHQQECPKSNCKPHYNEYFCRTPVNFTISKAEQSKKHPKPVFILLRNPTKIQGAVLKSNPKTHFKACTKEAADLGSTQACNSGAAVLERKEQDHQDTSSKKPWTHSLFPWPFSTLNQCLSLLHLSFLIHGVNAKLISQLQTATAACKVTTLMDFRKFWSSSPFLSPELHFQQSTTAFPEFCKIQLSWRQSKEDVLLCNSEERFD